MKPWATQRWMLAVAGIVLGLTLGHALTQRHDAAAREARSAQVASKAAAQASDAQSREARAKRRKRIRERRDAAATRAAASPTLQGAADAAVAAFKKHDIDSGVAIGTLGSSGIARAGELVDEPSDNLAQRLLEVTGALSIAPELVDKKADRMILVNALLPTGDGLKAFRTRATQGGGVNPVDTANTVLRGASPVTGNAVASAPTPVEVTAFVRSLALGCAVRQAVATRTILNALQVATNPQLDGRGSPTAVFPSGMTFSVPSRRHENLSSVALIGRDDNALVVAIATDVPTSNENRPALADAWAAIGKTAPPPSTTGAHLPRSCPNGGP